MANQTFSVNNASKPAPKWWRKLENGLLLILIPAAVAIIQGFHFDDELFAARLMLYINIGLVAIIKFIGVMLANGEDYGPAEKLPETYAEGPGGSTNPNPGGLPPKP